MQWSGGDGRIHSDIVHIEHCRCGAKRMAEDPLGAWKWGAEEYTRHADKRRTDPKAGRPVGKIKTRRGKSRFGA